MSEHNFVTKLDAEWDSIEPEPLTRDRIEEIVRVVVNARWCDGCGADRPFDPHHPEHWSDDSADGVLRHFCRVCTWHRAGGARPV
jgi:hypothetical protein